jgi:DnaJ-class molecular chaperone
VNRAPSYRPGTFTWAICPHCDGHGKRDNPAFSNGITSSEWAEWDCDERETYLSGAYDVVCRDCDGTGKVAEPIISRLTFTEKRALVEQRRRAEWRAGRDQEQRYRERFGEF